MINLYFKYLTNFYFKLDICKLKTKLFKAFMPIYFYYICMFFLLR